MVIQHHPTAYIIILHHTTSYYIIKLDRKYSKENVFLIIRIPNMSQLISNILETISNHLKAPQYNPRINHLKPCKKNVKHCNTGKSWKWTTSQLHSTTPCPTHKDWVHSCGHSRFTHWFCFLGKCQQVKLAHDMHQTSRIMKDFKISVWPLCLRWLKIIYLQENGWK